MREALGVWVGVVSPYLYFVLCRVRGVVRSSDNPGVVTTLLQFHHDIDEAGDTALHSFTQCSIVLCQYPPAVTTGGGGHHTHTQT